MEIQQPNGNITTIQKGPKSGQAEKVINKQGTKKPGRKPVKFKYKFWQWMAAIPRTEHASIKKEFATQANVSPRTIANWFDLESNSPVDIPASALFYMAARFGKEASEAANYPTTAKPFVAEKPAKRAALAKTRQL